MAMQKKKSIQIFLSVWVAWTLLGVNTQVSAVSTEEKPETNQTKDYFDMSIEDLMNVPVTTAGRKEQLINMAASNITVITEREIKDSGAQTLADVLERLPGVYIATTGSGVKTVYIRGIGERYNDKTVLLVDGYPTRDIYYYSYSPDETIPLGNIKKIEVIRGPGSSLYGTCAYAGIINVITKDAEDLKGTELKSGIGSHSSQQHQVLTGQKWEKGEVTFLARYLDADGGKVERDEGGAISGQPRYVRNAAFHMKAKYEDFDFQTGYYRTTTPDFMAPINEHSTTVTEDMFFRGGYKREISERLSMQARLYANLQWANEEKYTYTGDDHEDEKKITSRQSDLIGIDIQFLYKLSERNDLVFGMTHERENLEHQWSYKSKEVDGWVPGAKTGTSKHDEDFPEPIRNHSISFYAEDEFKLIPDVLHFTAGARFDRYTQTGSNLSPRFAAVWMLQKDTVVKLLYGEAFRSPSYREMYKVADPTTKTPEKIRTTELLLSHNLNSNHHLEISLFRSELKDYIKTLQSGGYENLKHRRTQGIEAGLRGKFPKADLSYFVNGTMLQTKDVDFGGIGGVPENMFNAGLTYEGIKHIAISPHVQYISKRNRPNDYQHEDEVEPENRRNNLGSYSLFNITVRTTDLPFELSFSVRNVFDKRYYSTSEKGQYDTQGTGRTFWLTLAYTFK